MKHALLILMATLTMFAGAALHAADPGLDKYLADFDYAARKEMKIDSKRLIELLEEGKAQLIDVRFKEEYAAWKVGRSC